MLVYWNGTDVTDYVNVTRCVCSDRARGADLLEIEFDRASVWSTWRRDDPRDAETVEVVLGEYTTGEMYVTTLLPCGDRFRVLATSLPPVMRACAWQSWKGAKVADILEEGAALCGMALRLYGMDGANRFAYLARQGQSFACFLDWLGAREGFCIKSEKGYFRAVDLEWAAARDPVQTIYAEESDENENVQRTLRAGEKWTTLTLEGPCQAVWNDSGAAGGHAQSLEGEPLTDAAQASRWAANLGMEHNGEMETVEIETGFSERVTALENIALTGAMDTAGLWTCWEAEHDLYNERTRMTLRRARTK